MARRPTDASLPHQQTAAIPHTRRSAPGRDCGVTGKATVAPRCAPTGWSGLHACRAAQRKRCTDATCPPKPMAQRSTDASLPHQQTAAIPHTRRSAPGRDCGVTGKTHRAQVRSYKQVHVCRCISLVPERQWPRAHHRPCPSSFGRTPAAPVCTAPAIPPRTHTPSHSIRTRSEECQQVRAVHLGVHEFTMSTHPRGVSPRER